MNDVVNNVPIIAIVDEDASVRRSLLRVVQSAGYEAETFASARAFLDWLPRNQAACLVLDVQMAEMNGFDLQKRLAVPIIFITARDDVPTLERIEQSGAAGHLRKPFGARTVLDAIGRVVRANHEPNGGADGGGPVHDTHSHPSTEISDDEHRLESLEVHVRGIVLDPDRATNRLKDGVGV